MSLRIFGVLATIAALVWGFFGDQPGDCDLQGWLVLIGMIVVAAGTLGWAALLHFRQLR